MSTSIFLLSTASLPWQNFFMISSSEFWQTAGTVLFSSIWQGAVIATALAISIGFMKRISAALRFTIWGAGFLAILGLPFIPLLFHLSHGITEGSTPLPDIPSNLESHSLLQLDIRWSIAIAAFWGVLSLYRLADLGIHSVRLRRLWKSAVPLDSSTLGLSAPVQLWGRKQIQICTTEELERPSVIGFLAPKVLIPGWLISRVTPGDLDQIILHETEHLRRGDDWTNLFQKLSLACFPLNPVLFWIERQLCTEREMACDEAVVRRTHAPRTYAACLASLAERSIERRTESISLGALSLGAWQRRSELVRRVHSILLRKSEFGAFGRTSVLVATVFGLALGSVELSQCPQLIAFTTTPDGASDQSRSPLNNQVASRMVDTGFSESAQVGANAIAPFVQPRMTQVKAIMPVRNRAFLKNMRTVGTTSAHASHTRSRSSSQTRPVNPVRPAPAQELLTSKVIEPSAPLSLTEQQTEAKQQVNQSWIVLTAWEEVETPNQGANQADNQAERGPGSTGRETGANVTSQPQTRLTVTRLILRVVPASSKLTSPTSLPARSGWLVIQL